MEARGKRARGWLLLPALFAVGCLLWSLHAGTDPGADSRARATPARPLAVGARAVPEVEAATDRAPSVPSDRSGEGAGRRTVLGSPAPPGAILLAVRCVDPEGEPLPGVRVFATRREPRGEGSFHFSQGALGTFEEALLTGEDGRAKFWSRAPGRVRLLARGERDVDVGSARLDPEPLVKGERRELDLTLERGWAQRVELRLVDPANGRPVVAARASVLPDPLTRRAPRVRATAAAEDEGVLHLLAPYWEAFSIEVRAPNRPACVLVPRLQGEASPGIGSGGWEALFARYSSAREEILRLEVPVAPSASLELEIADEEGSPAQGLDVILDTKPTPLHDYEGGGSGWWALPDPEGWERTTNHRGRLRVTRLPAFTELEGRFRGRSGFLPGTEKVFFLEPGRNRHPLTLGLQASLEGVALDLEGRPLPRAEVLLVRDVGERPFYATEGGSLLVADEAGRFRIDELTPGRFGVGLVGPEGRAGVPLLEPRQIVAGINVIEQRAIVGQWVEGRVLGWDGAGLEGAQVELRATDPRGEWVEGSAADGSFRMGPLLPGAMHLSVYSYPEHLPVRGLRVHPGAPYEIQLEQAGELRGRVTSPKGKRPNHASVLAWPSEGWTDPTELNALGAELRHGRFRLSGLPPGRWAVCARNPKLVAHARVDVAAGGLAEVDLRLEPGAQIVVLVRGRAEEMLVLVERDALPVGVFPPGSYRVPAGELEVELWSTAEEPRLLGRRILELAPGDEERVSFDLR